MRQQEDYDSLGAHGNGGPLPRIVVVDDEEAALGALRTLLEEERAEVRTFLSGAAALEFARTAEAALVLLDVQMSQMDGFQTAAALRKLPGYAHAPIVFLTGERPDRAAIDAAYRSGAVDFLLKPFDPHVLLSKVRVFLDMHQQKRQLESLVQELSEKKALELLVQELREAEAKREALEAELKRSEARLATVVNRNVDGLLVVDQQGIVRFVNPSGARLLGHPVERLLGEVFFLPEGEADRMELEGPEGTRVVEVRVAAIDWEDEPAHLAALRDVTAREQLREEQQVMEMQLRQAQKLEAIGQLAAGVAHEINTPTQYIGSNAQFLKRSILKLGRALSDFDQVLADAAEGALDPADAAALIARNQKDKLAFLREQIPQAIEDTLEGVEQVARIVGSMKEFSHPGSAELEPSDLHRSIENAITVSKHEWKYVATVETEFAPELPLVDCLEAEIKQVILNLIINAAHAIREQVGDSGQGKITVGTRVRQGWAEVFVRDTGCGMEPKVQARIFEPFFTTKGVGKGTGQGLALAYNTVVTRHGGSIGVDSTPGEGATFTIALPLGEQAESRPSIMLDPAAWAQHARGPRGG